MIDFSDVRIFMCTTPTSMSYSFDRLMGRAQEVFDQDPTSGHLFLFLFLNRRRDRIKILFWVATDSASGTNGWSVGCFNY